MPSLQHILVSFVLVSGLMSAGAQSNEKEREKSKNWFVSLEYGMQMSGIKNEDFVPSNYSPVYSLLIGREISPNFAVQIGYQGRYFRAISNKLRYNYNFYFVEGMVNMINLILGKKADLKYNLLLHLGPGYFYHQIYDRVDIHWNVGGSNHFNLSDNFILKIDASAIVGWDIYQGNSDILPNISFGVIYGF